MSVWALASAGFLVSAGLILCGSGLWLLARSWRNRRREKQSHALVTLRDARRRLAGHPDPAPASASWTGATWPTPLHRQAPLPPRHSHNLDVLGPPPLGNRRPVVCGHCGGHGYIPTGTP